MPILRAFLLVYPFLAVYVLVGAVLFVPLTWILGDIRPLYWVARQGVRLAFFLSGVKVKWVNRHYAGEGEAAVFISNHISNIDPPALFMTLPRIAVILKKELRKIPLLGYVMKLGGFIYVDRQVRDSRRRAIDAGVETLRRGISLLIFPEGTRSRDGRLLPFRPGPFAMAIEAGAPIVPITVHGTRELMPKGAKAIRPGVIAVVFHPPVETKGLSPGARNELMERVREQMKATLEGPDPRR